MRNRRQKSISKSSVNRGFDYASKALDLLSVAYPKFLSALFFIRFTFQQFGSGAIHHDTDYYRVENRRLTEEKNALQEQNDQLTEELRVQVEEQSKLEQEAELSRKANKDMKMEVCMCSLV